MSYKYKQGDLESNQEISARIQSNAKDWSMGNVNWYKVIKVQSRMFKRNNQQVYRYRYHSNRLIHSRDNNLYANHALNINSRWPNTFLHA